MQKFISRVSYPDRHACCDERIAPARQPTIEYEPSLWQACSSS
ncbi:MAG TPA: hypothetical protein VG326_10425 [Tepidisphaeraceae bacterium]|jgi:hypothetical protein|nr:hypothetical protein [Tepidisphaeraceae bacterium]